MTYGKYTAPTRTSTDIVYTKNSIYFNGVLIDGIEKEFMNNKDELCFQASLTSKIVQGEI